MESPSFDFPSLPFPDILGKVAAEAQNEYAIGNVG